MKKLICLLAIITVTFTACDQCEGINCLNGGTCEEGICECPNGFSGVLCEDENLCITNNVTCENGGTCEGGTCDCLPGFSGEACEIEDLCVTNSVTCENGECVDGECVCDDWYEGASCQDRVISKYDGLYAGGYACSQGTSTVSNGTASIIDIDELSEMKITENSGRTYNIEFTSNTEFDIPSQTTSDFNGQMSTVTGSGELDGDELEFSVSYTTTYQGSSTVNNCTFSGSN